MRYRKSETVGVISGESGLGSYSVNRVKDHGLKDKISKRRESRDGERSLGNSTPEIGSQFGNSGGFNASKFSNKKQVKPKTGAQLDEFGVPDKDYENDYLAEKSIESEDDD